MQCTYDNLEQCIQLRGIQIETPTHYSCSEIPNLRPLDGKWRLGRGGGMLGWWRQALEWQRGGAWMESSYVEHVLIN